MVWKIYIEFEMQMGDLQRGKKILYRAIRECPFCKGMCAVCGVKVRPTLNNRMTNRSVLVGVLGTEGRVHRS